MICMKCKQDEADRVLPSELFWCQGCKTVVQVVTPKATVTATAPQPAVREHREPQQFPFTDIFTAEKTDIF